MFHDAASNAKAIYHRMGWEIVIKYELDFGKRLS
jgi:hypothetical protein